MDAYHICQKSKLWQKLSAARRFAHPSSSYMEGSIKVIGSGYLCKRDTAQCDPSKLKGEKNYKSRDNYDKNYNRTYRLKRKMEQ